MANKTHLETLRHEMMHNSKLWVSPKALEILIFQALETPIPEWMSFSKAVKRRGHQEACLEHFELLKYWVPEVLTDYWETTALINARLKNFSYCSGRIREGRYWASISVDGVTYHNEHPVSETWALMLSLIDAILATH